MPTIDCKALLNTCTTRVYADNGFRILNAPVDVSPRRLRRHANDLQAAISVGTLDEEYPEFLRPDPLPTAETIRHACHQLEDPLLRFTHEFFWFWPMERGKSASDEGLLALKAGDSRQARDVWVRAETNGSPAEIFVARHNLAVLWHSTALDGEMRLLREGTHGEGASQDQEKQIDSAWQDAFKYWEPLSLDEAFWSLLIDRACAVGDPRLTTEFVKRFRDALPIAFDNVNADIAEGSARQGHYERARIHIEIMRQTDPGRDDVVASIRRITRPLHDRIDHAVGQATQDIQNHKREGLGRAKDLFEATKEPLQVLGTLLSTEEPEYEDTADQVAEAMLVCQVAYVNETRDWNKCKPTLQTSLELAQGARVKQRIRENVETLKTIERQEHELEVRKKEIVEDKVYDVKMSGVRASVPQVCTCCLGPAETTEEVSYSWEEQINARQKIQHTRSFRLPLCKACEQHRSELDKQRAYMILSSIGTAVVLLFPLTLLLRLAPFMLYLLVDGLVLAVVLTGFFFVFRVRPLGDEHASRGPSVSIARADKVAATFRFHNPVYAHRFAEANRLEVQTKKAMQYPRKQHLWPGLSAVQIVVTTVVVVLLCHAIVFGILKKHLEAHRDESVQRSTSTQSPDGPRGLRDSVVVCDRAKPGLSRLLLALPEKLRESSYREVGTVVILRKKTRPTGVCMSGALACVREWPAETVDRSESRPVSARMSECGKLPDSVEKGAPFGVCAVPRGETVQYLLGFLQRQDTAHGGDLSREWDPEYSSRGCGVSV